MGLFVNRAFAEWEIGDAIPDLGEFELSGDVPELKGKVTYMDFWASWCAPCRKAFPKVNVLYQKYKDNGFQVLAVGVDANRRAMDAFLEKSKPTFVTVHDSKQKLAANTGLDKMPTSYLIDEKGIIRFIHEGWRGKKSEAELEAHILELLGE